MLSSIDAVSRAANRGPHDHVVASCFVLEFETCARRTDAKCAYEDVVGRHDMAAGEIRQSFRIDIGEKLLLEVAHLYI